MIHRRTLHNHRHHITQEVRIAGLRTLYLSVHDDAHPAETFLRLKGSDCSLELIRLCDVIARLLSLALQYGARLAKVVDLLAGAKFCPCGPVNRHNRIKGCWSFAGPHGRHLLMKDCERHEVGSCPVVTELNSSS